MSNALSLNAYPDLARQAQAMDEDGYVYLPGVLGAVEVAELRAAMDRLEAIPASYDRHDSKGGFLNKSINNAFNRDRLFLSYVDRPGVVEIAEAIHGNDCHMIGMTAWLTGPGRPDQPLHADWQPLTLPAEVMSQPGVKIPIYISTAHFYLDDIGEELGPTQFIPGSHRAGRAQRRYGIQWRRTQEHPMPDRRRGHLPVGGLASRHRQPQPTGALSVAGALCPTHDHAEISTLSQPFSI